MAQAEKSATHSPGGSQNGEKNVVSLGPRDSLHGRLEIQGDLKIAGNVEGELKASGDVTVDSGAGIQASIEGSNVSIRDDGDIQGIANNRSHQCTDRRPVQATDPGSQVTG